MPLASEHLVGRPTPPGETADVEGTPPPHPRRPTPGSRARLGFRNTRPDGIGRPPYPRGVLGPPGGRRPNPRVVQLALAPLGALSAWVFMLISLLMTARTVLSVSITNVDRFVGEMPKPRLTPNCSATFRSVSASSG